MKPGGGHGKGASFERQVCRDLSLWLSNHTHDDLFWRSAMSGGRATVRFKKGRSSRSQAGDISPISAEGEKLTNLFLLECKHYRDLQMVGLYMGLGSGVNLHWKETMEDALRHDKWPMLIAKQNRLAPFVVLSRSGMLFFGEGLRSQLLAHFPRLGAYIFWYNSFLSLAQPPK